MKKITLQFFFFAVLFAVLLLPFSPVAKTAAADDDIIRLRMFFGLSLPAEAGGGAVSLADWRDFRDNDLAKTFDGFNIVDSVGYWRGKAERSKVVTLVLEESDIPKARALAARYAKRFKQESVMLVAVGVEEWSFVGAED